MDRRAFLHHTLSPLFPERTTMTASEDCIAALKRFEGFRERPYRDAVGVLTVGYGETRHVQPTRSVTEAQADLMLRAECAEIASELALIVKVPINQGQFDALVSFCYNLGAPKLLKSTLLGAINSGDFAFAATQFPRWCYAGGKVLPGLRKRREWERSTFLGEQAEV
jgi:lysozyme